MASWSGPQPNWHVSTQPMPQLVPCYVTVPPAPPTTGPAQPPNSSTSEQTITISTSQLLQRIAVLETELKAERENKSTLQQTCNYLIQQIRLNTPQTPPQSPKRDEDLIRAHRKSIVLREKIRLQRTYIRHLKQTDNRTGDLLTSGDHGSDQLLGLPTLSPASGTPSSSETTALWDSDATTPVDRSEEDTLARQEEKGHQGLGITAPEWKGKSRAPLTGREKQIPAFQPRVWIERRLRASTQAQTLEVASSQRIPPLSGQKALNPSAAAYVMPERRGIETIAKPTMQSPAAPTLNQSENHEAVRLQANPIPEEKLIDFAMSDGAEGSNSQAKPHVAPIPHSTHVLVSTGAETKSQVHKKPQEILHATQTQSPDSPHNQSRTLSHKATSPAPNTPSDISLTQHHLFYHPTPNDNNIHRTILATNIPPSATPSSVLAPICGGPVLSFRYMNTLSLLGTNSALIIFVLEASARAFVAYANTTYANTTAEHAADVNAEKNVRFGGIKYDLLESPTFPPSEEELGLMAAGRTRRISVRGIRPSIPLRDVRAEFERSEWQIDDGAVVGVERGGDGVEGGKDDIEGGGEGIESGGGDTGCGEEGVEGGEQDVVYLDMASLLAAQRVFWRVKYCRRFGELEVRFERDPCDRDVPSFGCGGEDRDACVFGKKGCGNKGSGKEDLDGKEGAEDVAVAIESRESSIIALATTVGREEYPGTDVEETKPLPEKDESASSPSARDANEEADAMSTAEKAGSLSSERLCLDS
ncbi:hypothetical protein BDV97DRAFT_366641 [Delphinella strobiligena]|nr:hypothetical protein BDV97DRAFT_366641 [Delphinella strobiligena]